jgi:sigma-B regulation protein RsbU (phosphoserine phosphatase)
MSQIERVNTGRTIYFGSRFSSILFFGMLLVTSLVETKGDTFPLGILEEVEYQETRLQLAPNDKVIFYADGMVEAMNKQEEMFGFERLLEVVKGARSLSADSLLKEIIDRVNEFAGGAAQHDDLTVIVVSVAA